MAKFRSLMTDTENGWMPAEGIVPPDWQKSELILITNLTDEYLEDLYDEAEDISDDWDLGDDIIMYCEFLCEVIDHYLRHPEVWK